MHGSGMHGRDCTVLGNSVIMRYLCDFCPEEISE
jgi:hypothetical protein